MTTVVQKLYNQLTINQHRCITELDWLISIMLPIITAQVEEITSILHKFTFTYLPMQYNLGILGRGARPVQLFIAYPALFQPLLNDIHCLY